jgi:hypothetical protein
MGMACPECGYSFLEAEYPTDEDVPHHDPYLEVGPKGGPSFRVSLLWIPGAGTGTSQ